MNQVQYVTYTNLTEILSYLAQSREIASTTETGYKAMTNKQRTMINASIIYCNVKTGINNCCQRAKKTVLN